jgi:hypothetical protein
MLGGEIDRRINSRYSNRLDPLLFYLGTYTPDLVGVNLSSAPP